MQQSAIQTNTHGAKKREKQVKGVPHWHPLSNNGGMLGYPAHYNNAVGLFYLRPHLLKTERC